MGASPKVSIVIPTRNRAPLLRRALASAVAQTLEDIEIIVSDNASTDDTADVVASFEDPRIVYAPLERNIGLHGNLTRCLTLGTAPYIGFLHDDDTYYPRNAEVKAAFFDEHPSVGAVYSPVDVVDASGEVIAHDTSYGGRPAPGVETGREYLRRMTSQMGLNDFTATMVRRRDVQGESFVVDDGNSCDLGFWMRLALRADFGFVDEVLSNRLLHESSQSTASGSESLNPDGSSSVTIEYIETMLQAKRRFFRLYGDQLEDPEGMRLATERAVRSKFATAVNRESRQDRELVPTLRRALLAARSQPGVLLEPRLARAVAAALVGHRGREAVRTMRGG